MLSTKGNEGFHKWWEQWISTRTQSRIGFESWGKLDGDIELTADPDESNRVQAKQVAASR